MQLNPWVTFIIAVLIAPTAEELLFRKLFDGADCKIRRACGGACLRTVFGLFHGNLNQFSYAFLLGLFFGIYLCKNRKTAIYHRTPYGDQFYRLFPRHMDASGDGLYGYDGNTDEIFKYKGI